MIDDSSHVIYYINGIIYLAMLYYGFICIFKPINKKRWIVFAYISFLIISSLQYFIFENVWLNLVVNTMAIMAISLLFSGNISTRLIFALLLYIMSILADSISFVGLSYVYRSRHGAAMPIEYLHSVQRTVTNIIYLPLTLILIQIFRQYFISKVHYKNFKIPSTYTLSVLLAMAGVILIDLLYMVAAINEIQTKAGQIIVTQFIILGVIFLIIWLYNTILSHLEALEASRIKNLMSERWEIQYNAAMLSQKTIEDMNHNLRYHFLTLAGHLKENKIKTAKKYLADKLGEIGYIINTGNISIDTMMNYYCQQAKDILGIDLDTEIQIPSHMNLNDGYIATILGNALENAIEACEKVTPPMRHINVKAALIPDEANSNLLVTITNPYLDLPIADNEGNLITSKSDKRNHGLGLASIIEMLPEKIGHIHYEYDNNIFRFMFIYYNVIEKKEDMLSAF